MGLLLHGEGVAVGAFLFGGIYFVAADRDGIQGAVAAGIVVAAGGDRTVDAGIFTAVFIRHGISLRKMFFAARG